MEWLNKAINLIKTLPSKISEPSTWAGVGVGLIGLVFVVSGNVLLGILISIVGIAAIVISESNSSK